MSWGIACIQCTTTTHLVTRSPYTFLGSILCIKLRFENIREKRKERLIKRYIEQEQKRVRGYGQRRRKQKEEEQKKQEQSE